MKNDIIELTRKNDIKGVKKFIDEGGDVNLQDKMGWTALMFASYWNHPAIVKLLIDAGAKLDLQNEKDETALFISIDTNNFDVAEILLKSGASIGLFWAKRLIRNSLRETKLIELIQLLIKCKKIELARDLEISLTKEAKQEARDQKIRRLFFFITSDEFFVAFSLLTPILISLFFLIIGILKYYHIIN